MEKKRFVDHVVNEISRYGLTKKVARQIYEDVIEEIRKQIYSEGLLRLADIGTFKVVKRKKRIARNVKTGEQIIIPERYILKFKPSKNTKQYVNEIFTTMEAMKR